MVDLDLEEDPLFVVPFVSIEILPILAAHPNPIARAVIRLPTTTVSIEVSGYSVHVISPELILNAAREAIVSAQVRLRTGQASAVYGGQ